MDAIKNTWNQYAKVFQALPGSQRLTLLAVTGLIVAGLAYVVFRPSSAGYVAASLDKEFSPDEMRNAQEVLRSRGLTRFKQEGNKLLVPRGEVDQYNMALLEGGGLPSDWASELEKQFDKDGWFPSDRQSRNRRQIALARALRNMILHHPAVEDASVIWAASKPKRFSGRSPNVTATVNIKPKNGQELPAQLVNSLRLAVGSAVPDLKPENVTIFNMRTGEAYAVEDETPFDGRLLSWIKQHTERYKKKVEEQLSYIPGVLVAVDVEIENLESFVEETKKFDEKSSVTTSDLTDTTSESSRNQQPRAEPGERPNEPRSLAVQNGGGKTRDMERNRSESTRIPGYTATLKKYLAAMPKSVKVSVAIREEYFQKVAQQETGGGNSTAGGGRGNGTSRDQILADVKQMVAHTVGADQTAVEVRPYIRVDEDIPEIETSFADTAMTMLAHWGGPVALGIFALWALWMVRKSMPKLPDVQTSSPGILARPSEDDQPPQDEPETPPEPAARDRLQGVVRDNPEMAANVLSQWLKTAG